MKKGAKQTEESKRKMSLAHIGIKRPDLRNEKHGLWKGDQVGYDALHDWVNDRKGKARYCSFNPNHVSTRYEWANISGAYLRDVDDYASLCHLCHMQYDIVTNKRRMKKYQQKLAVA